MRTGITTVLALIVFSGILFSDPAPALSRQIINLSLDSAVEIAMGTSYRIQQLQMGIERNRLWLKARQASLKSRVYMNLIVPEYNVVSENKWNSTIQKDEIVRENTRLWQMDLAIRQPVLLMGYPTNGYLSLNNKTYKYLQRDGERYVNFYNRYYVKYEQPFFLPNELKNDIEDAELDLEDRELEYIRDRMWLVDRIADDYYDLFEFTYNSMIYNRQIENLETIKGVAEAFAMMDSTRAFDVIQTRMELVNTQEERMGNQIALRRQEAESKQNLRLSLEDSVYVVPEIEFKPISIDEEKALEYGVTLNPDLRMLNIEKRKDEIEISDVKGEDAFHVNLEMTYGLEKQNERYQELWEEFDKSYSTSLNMYVPIWDWGRRKARIESREYSLKITELQIEEQQNEIRSDIMNAIQNLREYRMRTENMMESMKIIQNISDRSIEQYRQGNISLQDLLQIVSRQKDTEINFIEAYQGYKRSLISLMTQTYYDFENDVSLIDTFLSDN